jgi:diacylglycerol kinase family enzyme
MGRTAHSRACGSQRLRLPLNGFLIINPGSGKGRPDADELAAEARQWGLQAHVLRPGEDAAELARGSSAAALGMAGGDGSLAAVAEVALERDAAFAVVPFGKPATTSRAISGSIGTIRSPHSTLSAVASVAST